MILTCTRCFRTIAIRVGRDCYELRTTCPTCGQAITVEVSVPFMTRQFEIKALQYDKRE